jgi:hypothetical protein
MRIHGQKHGNVNSMKRNISDHPELVNNFKELPLQNLGNDKIIRDELN